MNSILLKLLAVVSLFSSGLLIAADAPPPYLSALHGTLVTGIVDRAGFEFQPGQLENCVRKEGATIVKYNCDVKNTSAAVIDAAKGRQDFVFATMTLIIARVDGKVGYYYTLYGNFEGKEPYAIHTSTALSLSYSEAPTKVNGKLVLTDLDVSGAIQAAP